jgi:hypothetical protein
MVCENCEAGALLGLRVQIRPRRRRSSVDLQSFVKVDVVIIMRDVPSRKPITEVRAQGKPINSFARVYSSVLHGGSDERSSEGHPNRTVKSMHNSEVICPISALFGVGRGECL